jgi:ABC-type bacteriocin/lantibiotic exporter with double-glycine peptidase domain
VVILSHRPEVLTSVDNILVLSKGEVVAQGVHKTLFETSLDYRNLFALTNNMES